MASPELSGVVDRIENGAFSGGDKETFAPLVGDLRNHDWFFVAADFDAYSACQRQIDEAWTDPDTWTRKAILNTAAMGRFWSDRTIRGYAHDIWQVDPVF